MAASVIAAAFLTGHGKGLDYIFKKMMAKHVESPDVELEEFGEEIPQEEKSKE